MTNTPLLQKAINTMEKQEWKKEIMKRAPHWVSKNYGEKFVSNLTIAFTKNPKLLECDFSTIKSCILELSDLGLMVGGAREQASLVPVSESKRVNGQWIKNWKCELIIGYKGAIDLISRLPNYSYVRTKTVYKKDKFVVSEGTTPRIDHEIDYSLEEKDEDIIAFYAILHFNDGTPPLQKVITKKEGDSAKEFGLEKFKYSKEPEKQIAKSPWTKKYAEMGEKTAILRLAKRMAANKEIDQLLNLENQTSDTNAQSPIYDGDYIEQNSDEFLIAELENNK